MNKKYRVIYTTFIEVEAKDYDEALTIASETKNLEDFIFYDAEVEEIEGK